MWLMGIATVAMSQGNESELRAYPCGRSAAQPRQEGLCQCERGRHVHGEGPLQLGRVGACEIRARRADPCIVDENAQPAALGRQTEKSEWLVNRMPRACSLAIGDRKKARSCPPRSKCRPNRSNAR